MANDIPKKKVDEEWKQKARAEAAKAEAAAEAAEAADNTDASERPHVPLEASFAMLVQSFATEALIALGAVENPFDGKRVRDLSHAKYAIDTLQLISDKTQGNLSAEEKKMLDTTLFDLRMRFLGQ